MAEFAPMRSPRTATSARRPAAPDTPFRVRRPGRARPLRRTHRDLGGRTVEVVRDGVGIAEVREVPRGR
ncbi:MAG TPA: hypothetical protein VFJ98_10525 [Mycobacteriales bacterium]|jgi:hypothetical protein|nr:hypothetical protein [Mycobacteriales bacterium]